MYGHLLVMAIINITIPFLLITWAEQSVESSLAAILTSPVPLFAIVLSSIFLPDEPMRVNGVVGLIVGFIGVVIITSPGLTGAGSSVGGELALLGAAFSYACGAVYARRNVRGLAPMVPAVFQVTFAAIITGVARAAVRASLDGPSRHAGDLLDPVARDPRVGDRLPRSSSGCSRLGRDADDARRVRHPGRRASCSATWSSPSRSTAGSSSGPRWSSPESGWSTAGSVGDGSSGGCHRSRRSRPDGPSNTGTSACRSSPR